MQIKKPKIPIFCGGLSLTANPYKNLRTSFLLLFLSILTFTFVPYLVAEANAETASVALDWSRIILELDTGSNSGNVAFNDGNAIIPDNIGRVATQAKTLTINTTGKHFNVYLSMDSSVGENQKLCYDFDATDAEKGACAHTGIGISPVSENDGAPAKLSGNTWGYALNDGEAGFSAAGTYSNGNLSGNTISSTTENTYDLALYNAKWAAVPVFGSEDLIWSANTTNNYGFGTNTVSGVELTGDPNNTKTIVYGVQVNNGLVAGTYGSKIVYTAVATASDINSPSTNVLSSLVYGGPSDVTTLVMDMDVEGTTIRERDITISLVKHSDTKIADTNNDGTFTSTELETAKTAAVGTCDVVAHSLEMESGQSLTVQCVLPELGLNEGTDYDYIVEVPIPGSLTKKYISYNTDGADEGVIRYVGLQTKDGNNDFYVDTMQGITPGICAMTNTWGTGTGSDARIYGRTGTGQALANTAEASNALGLGTFALKDTRDNKQYLVRRLADGNCWMVQNLDLDLTDEDNRTLSPATSDVTEERTLSTKNLSEEIGSSCSEQYQPYNVAGSNCLWGSTKGGISVTNNTDSAFARSYSNTEGSNPRYVPTHQINGTYDSYSTSSNGTDNAPVTTSGYTPTVSANSGNAVGFYGTMYIGTYYNWYAAVAETANRSTSNTTMSDSLCARGWQLPNGSNGDPDSSAVMNLDKSWTKLLKNTTNGYGTALSFTTDGGNNTTAATNMHKLPLSIPFAGLYHWSDGKLYNRGTFGYYWSSTASTAAATARYLGFYSSTVWSQPNRDKTYGFTIRCVARDTEATTVAEEEAVACEAGKICYNSNGGSGEMDDQSATADADVMLTAPTFNKLGYAFVGWNTQENGFGTTYQADETITAPSSLDTEGLQLYAKWLPSAGTMQNWSSCSTLGEHETVALTDNRDNKTYAVRKMKDGNCWMVNNLNLELADFAGTHKLTSSNTDLTGSGRSYWDPSESTIAKYQSGESFPEFTLRVLGQSQPAQFQSEDQTGYWWGSKKSDDGNYTDLSSVTNNANAEIPRSYNAYAQGYYNWYSATAESGTYSMTDTTASDSICPKGWQLPVDTSSSIDIDKTWTKLLRNTTYGYGAELSLSTEGENNTTAVVNLHKFPLSTTFAGLYIWDSGTFANRRTSSTYHGAAAASGTSIKVFYHTSSGAVWPRAGTNKLQGLNIRCVNK